MAAGVPHLASHSAHILTQWSCCSRRQRPRKRAAAAVTPAWPPSPPSPTDGSVRDDDDEDPGRDGGRFPEDDPGRDDDDDDEDDDDRDDGREEEEEEEEEEAGSDETRGFLQFDTRSHSSQMTWCPRSPSRSQFREYPTLFDAAHAARSARPKLPSPCSLRYSSNAS